jgi:acyl carrier protein
MIEDIVKSVIEKYAKKPITKTENFIEETDIDSLSLINVLMDLEEELNIEFDLSVMVIEDVSTLEDMVNYVTKLKNQALQISKN